MTEQYEAVQLTPEQTARHAKRNDMAHGATTAILDHASREVIPFTLRLANVQWAAERLNAGDVIPFIPSSDPKFYADLTEGADNG